MMNQRTKTLLLLGGFAVLLAVAFFGYRALSAAYENETSLDAALASPAPEPQQETSAGETQGQPAPTPILAPDFSVQTADGETVRLSDFRGKPVVLNFWASWCGPCKSEMPAFDKAYAAYGEDVAFLMVNMTDGQRETVDDAKAFVEESGYRFPVYYDTEMNAAYTYGVYSIPMTFLVDAEGCIVGGQNGVVSEAALLSAVEQMKDPD